VQDSRRGTKKAALGCVFLGLFACAGGYDTPEVDPVRGAGGSAGRAGNAGSAGQGGRAVATPPDAGVGGNAGTRSEPPPEPDAGEVVNEPPRQHCDAVEIVFKVSCGGGSCHSNPGVTIGDFAVGSDEARAYINRVSVRNAECGLIINPGSPRDSLILTKVTNEYPKGMGCGNTMPVGSFGDLTTAQIRCLEDWVDQFGE